MSDGLRLSSGHAGRPLRAEENALLTHLLRAASAVCLAEARVMDMSDGRMGGIRFAPFASARRYGSTLVEARVADADGVLVSLTLNVDQQGRLFELDVWKVDFSPLLRYPNPVEVTLEPPPAQGSTAVHLPHPA